MRMAKTATTSTTKATTAKKTTTAKKATTARKAATVKKTTAAKKTTTAKKATTRTTKTAASRARKKAIASTTVIQFQGLEFSESDCLKKAKAGFLKHYRGIELKDLKIYIKPEERKIYYVGNGDRVGSVDL